MSQNKAPAAANVSTLPKHIPIVYIIYAFGNAFSNTMPLTYLTFFITEFTGVSPTLMATVFTIARFADLGVSMISGAIIQRQKRVRPWVLGIPIVSGTGAIICFANPPVPIPVKLVILIVGYCCIHFPMNFMTVATNTLLMKIAGPNPANRLAITGSSLRGSSASRIAISAITLPLIMFFMDRGLPGYFIVTLIYVSFTVSANFMLFTVSKSYEPKDAANAPVAPTAPQTNILKMYGAAAKNKPILVLLICSMVTGVGGQVLSAGLLYYWRYSVGNMMMQPVAGTIAGFVALGTSVIGPPIARKIGKRASLLLNYFWASCCYVLHIMFSNGNAIAYIIISSMLSLTSSISLAWGINLWLDAAEIQLYETGVDNRPFLMSLSNLPIKLGFIASGPFVAIMLNNSGYTVVDGVGTMADTGRFMLIWLGIVLLCYLIPLVLFFFGYKVDANYAAEAAAANAKAAADRAAAAGSGGAAPAR